MSRCRSRPLVAARTTSNGAGQRRRVAEQAGWVALAAAGPPGSAGRENRPEAVGQREDPAAADQRAISTGPILVVDDDSALRQTVAAILVDEGYPVEEAADGAEALEAVERRRPSLVLLDMRMPVLDGWSFARALRERGIRVPIIVMTAAQDARRWAEEIEADDWLAKPFELLDLIAAVERLRRG